MYDCARSSLYGSEGKCEIEELTDEIESSIRKDTIEGYREKLDNSIEIENYNAIKLKKIVPLIIKLKEEYQNLDELKKRGIKLKEESKRMPYSDELSDMASLEVEKYDKKMEYFINEADEILGADEFSKSFKNEKTETYMDHKLLLKTLKMYRKIFKEQIDIQKEMRKKMIAVLMVGIEDEFVSDTGTLFIDFLKEDITKYNKEMQRELKKYSLDKLKEVLLNLKLLTNVYGYSSSEITLDFILNEMEKTKSILKKDRAMYENNSKYLREFSESNISEIKTILIEEVKGNLAKQIKKLKDEKKELESILKDDKKLKEISDIKIEQQKIKKEIQRLYTLKSSQENGETINEDDENLDEKIRKTIAKSIKLNGRLDELNDHPKEVLCNLGGILGIVGLGMNNMNKDKGDLNCKDSKSTTEIESFSEEELFIKKEENVEYTDIEDTLRHYNIGVEMLKRQENEDLSYEEFHVKLKYYQERIKIEERLSDIKPEVKKEKMIDNEIEESVTNEDFNYKTEELLSDEGFSEGKKCVELEEEVLSEQNFDYKTEELLSDEELKDNEKEESLSEKDEYMGEVFEEYIPMKEEDKKNLYIKLSDVSSKLRNLEWRFERLNKALKDIKKRTKQYDKLIEKQEDRKDRIRSEIEKYDVLKNLTEEINRGKDASYQLLYT